MRAVMVQPGVRNSVEIGNVPEPSQAEGAVLVQTLAVGVCGTDLEIVQGLYGNAPKGADRLVIGHESLGRVLEAPPGCGLAAGDLIVGIVRRPDPIPCANCAIGEWDMCRNGLYTECGIKERHGFARERFRIEPEFAVKVDPALGILGVLLEPASVLAKAWEHVERIGRRAHWEPRKALITGAGPVGLLGALMGVQRGYDVHVLDRVTEGPKPGLVRAIGATYHTTSVKEAGAAADIIIECTGASRLVLEAMEVTGRNGITCLTGISSGGRTIELDIGLLNRTIVLENDVIFGSVNANRRHYEQGAAALARADRNWLSQLVTRRVPLEQWKDAYERRPGDVKTVIEFAQ